MTVKYSFPGLCDSNSPYWVLWDTDQVWNSPNPDFPLCFQYTVLYWIPMVYLIIHSSIWLLMKQNLPTVVYQRRGNFNIFKSILIAVLFFVHIINLCYTISEEVSNKNPPNILFIQPVLSALFSLLLIYINKFNFSKGIHTSSVEFFYWLLELVVTTIFLYSRYQSIELPHMDVFRTVTTTIEFILVLVIFFCNCFADKAVFNNRKKRRLDSETLTEEQPLLIGAANKLEDKVLKPCPEMEASFLSQLTFTWLYGMIIRGYRKPLTSADLFDLQYKDSCRKIVPRMESQWLEEINRVEQINRKTRKPKKYGSQTRYQSLVESEDETDFQETSFTNTDNVQHHSKEGPKKKVPSFFRALYHTVGYHYTAIGAFKLIYDLITFVQPQLLGSLISFIENPKDLVWHGILISVLLFLTALVRTVIFQNYWNGCYITGMHTRTAVIGLIYRKAMRLSTTSRKDTTVGEIVNLMSVDAQKLQDVPGFLHLIWSSPIIMIIAIAFLWQELGPAVLAGLGLMVCLIPVNAFIGSRVKKLQVSQMRMKDNRIKLVNEILSGMKILKLYAWENSFEEKIQDLREKECRVLRKATYLNAIGAVSWFCAPFLVALCSFAAYVLASPTNVLTANKAFVSLSLFNILNFPMSMLPGTIVYGIQAYVSVQRINKFLLGDEIDEENVQLSPPNECPIKIENGSFTWVSKENEILKNINFEVDEGSLVAIVGTVGSGKSSLISAVLGEMKKLSGRVLCRGSLAYVPQQAWCMNATLQDNILFNQPFVHSKYNKIIEACALKDDLKVLPDGDQTEVGEKGINLSGGQKQRISLARAVYQDTSIYILDDPLSAVDSHVGKHIFNEVIGSSGLLANKTRILVTHSLTCLPKVDKIFVMTDGEISESGTYKELLNKNGAFAEYLRTYLEQEEEEEVEDSEDEGKELKAELRRSISRTSSHHETDFEASKEASVKHHRRTSSVRLSKSRSIVAEEEEKEARVGKRKLIEEEVAEVGGVRFSVFLSYLKATTYLFAFLVIFSYSLYLSCSIGANLFLSYWSETGSVNGTTTTASRDLFLGVYGGFGLGQTIFILIENFALAYGTYLASRSLHKLLLHNVLRAPNSFFDTTPMGRILNRIGKDIDTVDSNIPQAFRIWLATAAGVIGTVIVISIASPYFLIALLPLGVFYYFIQRFYICTSRQLKRIDSIKRSPIYSHFQESIVGATSIRAYKMINKFVYKCDILTDENQMAWYPNIISYRWLQFNLEFIGNLIILVSGLLAVFTRDYIGGGLAGLSVSYSLQVTGSLNFMVRMTCDLESYTVAVERIQEYADVEPEAEWVKDNVRPPLDWPKEGHVEFYNYSVRYRPGLELVLRNLNFKVNAGEKIGIVGRTGAGKSSLTLALFRLIEPAEGTIFIDGLDITKYGLHDIRNKLTIIPQDPVLFSGSLRMNLDPFNAYSDGELWTALELAHLKGFVSKMPVGLESFVSEGGENLSVGQRQLVCLARALLKKTRVLVLDEATAAVDLETDDLIQNSIRRQFKQCTVLTIAHRLNTIMDYDKILVLDNGQIRELDSPENLLANERSVFHGMARDAGLV